MEEEQGSDEEGSVVFEAATDPNDRENIEDEEMDEVNDGNSANSGEDGSGGGASLVEVIEDTQDDPPSSDLFTPEDKALPLEPALPKRPGKAKIQVFGTTSSTSSRLAHAQVRLVDYDQVFDETPTPPLVEKADGKKSKDELKKTLAKLRRQKSALKHAIN